jgi:hypothetical protein
MMNRFTSFTPEDSRLIKTTLLQCFASRSILIQLGLDWREAVGTPLTVTIDASQVLSQLEVGDVFGAESEAARERGDDEVNINGQTYPIGAALLIAGIAGTVCID